MNDAEKTIDPKLTRLIHTAEAPGILYGSCLDPTTGNFYGGGADGHVYRMTTRPVETLAEKATAEKLWRHHENYVSSLAWLDGIVVSGSYDHKLVWTRPDGEGKIREINAHDGWVRKVVVIPGRNQLASIGDDMCFKLWDAVTGQAIHNCQGHASKTPEGFANSIYSLAASNSGKLIASADRTGVVMVWDIDTGKQIAKFRAETFYTYDAEKRARSIGGIRSLAFSPDGTRLALGGIGQVSNVDGFVGPCRVEVWDWQAEQRTFVGTDKHAAILNHIQYLPDSDLLVGAGGGDGGPLIAFWDLKAEVPLAKAKPKSHIQHFAYDDATQQLLAVGHAGLQVWAFTPAPTKESTAAKKG
ncbi:WD domain, G-beta repeat [Anatilimnocola aggregata]|uniref:WD domain, G-beta repeat n=1 Tax=Anatilimnocola aggregata TaxID=2528021 RepID=A0A517YEF8_9BACT|nr:hypothetical protein [Anatilimnocola aggregata]QDU28620.1 WD domain, G-beta repeat [Anatilimnocola aggregata]